MNRLLHSRKGILLLSWVVGLATALTQAPYFWLPLLFLTLPVFYGLLLQSKTGAQAFWCAWFFGFGYFLAGLYWIVNALLVDAEQFAWLIPFAVSLVPAGLAIYIGLCGLAFYLLKSPRDSFNLLLFAALWTGFELLRGVLFTGFPWNSLGYATFMHDSLPQFASVVGAYGLSFLLVLACIPLYAAIIEKRWVYAAFPLVIVGFLAVFGVLRLAYTPFSYNTDVMVRIVQGNVAQDLKWDLARMHEGFERHLTLTQTPIPPDIPHKNILVVWPETAVPFFLNHEDNIRRKIGDALAPNSIVLTGLLRAEISANGEEGNIYNSLGVLDNSGEIIAFYDKHTLVPFGEYVPFRRFLPFIDKITPGGKDFSNSPGLTTLFVDNYPAFSPLICYEVIFPGSVTANDNAVNQRPQLLVNITNDAWFGDSAGPYQHFTMSRMRAIEEGLPLIRAANTGISAMVNPLGIAEKKLLIGQQGVIDAALPNPLAANTLYSSIKNWLLIFVVLLVIAARLILIKK